jgi:competence protein ComEC
VKSIPAVKLAILLALGIVLGDALASAPWAVFLFAGAALLGLSAFLGRRANWGQAALVGAVVLSASALLFAAKPPFDRVQEIISKPVWIRGKVLEQYRSRSDRQVHVLAPNWIWDDGHDSYRTPGHLRLLSEAERDVPAGSLILLRGTIEAYPPRRNPGGRDWRAGFLRNGIIGWVKPDSVVVLRVGRGGILAKWRQSLSDHLHRSLPPREADLLAGMILGDKGLIPEDLHDDFKRSGLYHLLVVSGANIGYLLATVTMLLSPLGLGLRWRRAVMLLCIWGYVLLTNLQPATVRAAIMISIIILSFEFRRVPRRWNLWGAAAAIILLFAPQQIFQPGFQLSFAAMAGLLFAADVHARRELTRPILPLRSRKYRRYITRHLSFPLLASLCAVVFTAPILIFHFGGFAPIAIVLNLLAVPLTGAIFSLAWILLLLSIILGTSLGPLNAGLEWGLKLLEQLAVWGSQMPGHAGSDYGGLVTAIILFIALIVVFLLPSWPKRALTLLGALALLVILMLWPPSPHLQIEFLDVGQGDATLLRFPGGWTLLVDCGGEESARFELLPSLIRRGIRRIDALLITHFDKDHAGGAQPIMQELKVKRLLVNSLEPKEELGRSILDIARARGIPVQSLALGDTIAGFPGSRCLVLWPPRDFSGEDNAASIVLRVSFGENDVLLMSDISSREEADLASAGSYLESEVLKVAHHGSAKSSSRAFLELVKPQQAVICCGARNSYGHPAARTLESLSAVGAAVHRTDLNHAGIWRSDGERIWQVAWR